MGVTQNPCGLYRAYKKINKHETQAYFCNIEDAEAEQARLDALAALNPPVLFVESGKREGRMIGVSVGYNKARPAHPASISGRIQTKNYRKEVKYRGNFEAFWRELVKHWKLARELTPADSASYRREIKAAKNLYIQDVAKFEIITK